MRFFFKYIKVKILRAAWFCIPLLLTGCMMGPDFQRPDTAATGISEFANMPAEWSDPNDGGSVGAWWKKLGDPTIDQLVEAALEKNTSLQAAAANVRQAQALLESAHGARLPDISYSIGRTRTKNSIQTSSFGLPAGGGRINSISTEYSQDITISWIADIFGKLRRAERAAMADLIATQDGLTSLKHGVIAQVTLARIEVARQQRLLEIALKNIDNWEKSLEIVERRYDSGVASPVEVYLARENLAATKATEVGVRRQLAIAQHALDVLTGVRPGSTATPADTLPDIPTLEPIPAGLPAALLDRRPDVRSAEARLEAATERVGVSVASLYPDFTLTGSAGFRSSDWERIGNTEGFVYSAITNILAPIWKGGQLRANVRASEAAVEAAAAEYAGVVLTALQEVEDALISEQLFREELEHLQVRLEEASRAETLARQRYSRGVEGVLGVLETERRRRAAENQLVLGKAALWSARVNLYLAIGGDWNTNETKPNPGT